MRLVDIILGEWDESEVKGSEVNPGILEYLSVAGIHSLADETPWCAALIAWAARQCGLPLPPNPALARSWLLVGQAVIDPVVGDVVVLSRTESWQGHVGVFVRKLGDEVLVLGGNQGDRVTIAKYSASRVLGFRRLM